MKIISVKEWMTLSFKDKLALFKKEGQATTTKTDIDYESVTTFICAAREQEKVHDLPEKYLFFEKVMLKTAKKIEKTGNIEKIAPLYPHFIDKIKLYIDLSK